MGESKNHQSQIINHQFPLPPFPPWPRSPLPSRRRRHSHELTEDVVTIGRISDNVIQINDASVSSHHAEITLHRQPSHPQGPQLHQRHPRQRSQLHRRPASRRRPRPLWQNRRPVSLGKPGRRPAASRAGSRRRRRRREQQPPRGFLKRLALQEQVAAKRIPSPPRSSSSPASPSWSSSAPSYSIFQLQPPQ